MKLVFTKIQYLDAIMQDFDDLAACSMQWDHRLYNLIVHGLDDRL